MSGISGVSSSGMSTSSGLPSSNRPSSSLSGAATLPPLATPALGKGPKAAREFEAQLIGTVLQSFEKTFAALPGQDAMAGEDDYNYLGTQAFASAIAAGGGFGIAKLISEHLGSTKVAIEGTATAPSESASGPVKAR
jgi:Rod binding domain-containing protein